MIEVILWGFGGAALGIRYGLVEWAFMKAIAGRSNEQAVTRRVGFLGPVRDLRGLSTALSTRQSDPRLESMRRNVIGALVMFVLWAIFGPALLHALAVLVG